MERSSPSRTAGVVIRKVRLGGGAEYTLSQPDKVRKAADEEAVVIARRIDMLPALAKACQALPEESRAAWRRDYINMMVCGIATPEEWSAYYRSFWQLAFRFFNALDPEDKNKKGVSLLDGVAWAYEMVSGEDVTKEEIDSLWLAIRMVSQEDAVKNSSGSEEADTPPMADPSSADGQSSTPTSPKEG